VFTIAARGSFLLGSELCKQVTNDHCNDRGKAVNVSCGNEMFLVELGSDFWDSGVVDEDEDEDEHYVIAYRSMNASNVEHWMLDVGC
jgi:hypothetical protein